MAPAQSSHFCRTELARALREQAYAIKEHALTASDVHQASADVVTLEGTKVIVTLTIHGYTIADNTYEDIEAALSAVSPMYTAKRTEALMAALAGLA